jgi:hypothetical protein
MSLARCSSPSRRLLVRLLVILSFFRTIGRLHMEPCRNNMGYGSGVGRHLKRWTGMQLSKCMGRWARKKCMPSIFTLHRRSRKGAKGMGPLGKID